MKQPRPTIAVSPRTYAKLVKQYSESDYAKLEKKFNLRAETIKEQVAAINNLPLENRKLEKRLAIAKRLISGMLTGAVFVAIVVTLL